MDNLELGKKIKKNGIISLVLAFTLIGAVVSVVLTIIGGIKILSTDWQNEQLNKDKTLWGIFCFVILGPIAMIVFGGKVVSTLGASQPSQPAA